MILECIILILLSTGIAFILWAHSNPLRWLIKSHPLTCSRDRHRQDCVLCTQAKECLSHLHRQAQWLHKQPELAGEILQRLQDLLPSRVIFKEQRARLHNLAHNLYERLMHRLKQNQHHGHENSKIRHNVHIRLTKLNKVAAEQEKRISNFHRIAENYALVKYFRRFPNCIKIAVKLQHSNGKLLKNIHRTEKYLLSLLRKTKSRKGSLPVRDNKTERFK